MNSELKNGKAFIWKENFNMAEEIKEYLKNDAFGELSFDVEKYSAFFLLLNRYFNKYLKGKIKETIISWPATLDYVIKVTPLTLRGLEMEIPWNEFSSLMVELEEDLKFGMPDKILLKVAIQDQELKMELEADVFKYLAECPPLDESVEENDEKEN